MSLRQHEGTRAHRRSSSLTLSSPRPKAAVVPSAQTLKITDFSFSDFELSDVETALCTIRMFTDLNLVQNFQMKHEVGGGVPGEGTVRACACVHVYMCVCVCVRVRTSMCVCARTRAVQ